MLDRGAGQPGLRAHHRDPRGTPRDDPRTPGHQPFSLRGVLGRGRPGGNAIRRGEIRPLVLATLGQRPMHGYEVIQELESQSGGRWRPSAGSVYPMLQQLADEGLVTGEEVDGRRIYTLTDTGREAAAAVPVRTGWTAGSDRGPDLRRVALDLARAAIQVQAVGSPRTRAEAELVLADARRQLYRLLADDEPVGAEPSSDEPA